MDRTQKPVSNPYIDYNLLKSQQSQFSPHHNKRFEQKHAISLKFINNNTKSIVTNIMFIKFKWNERLNNKYECDTKHLLYLIYLSLIKVEERQRFKNKYYVQINRSERVLKLLDKEQIITNLISWYNKDPENNKLNGDLLKTMPTKDFINNVLTGNGGKQCTMGWSTKIYSKLINEITINGIHGMVSIPNYKYNKLITDAIIWSGCTMDDIIKILQSAFKKTEEYFITNYLLKNYHDQIMAYWINKNMNGTVIQSMNEKNLINKIKKSLVNHLNHENDKLLQPQIDKLIDIFLTECDLNEILP